MSGSVTLRGWVSAGVTSCCRGAFGRGMQGAGLPHARETRGSHGSAARRWFAARGSARGNGDRCGGGAGPSDRPPSKGWGAELLALEPELKARNGMARRQGRASTTEAINGSMAIVAAAGAVGAVLRASGAMEQTNRPGWRSPGWRKGKWTSAAEGAEGGEKSMRALSGGGHRSRSSGPCGHSRLHRGRSSRS